MLKSFGLEVTGATTENLSLISQSTELLFRKKSGIEKLLPSGADQYESCPMLQICSATMYFLTFSAKTIKEKFPIYLARIQSAQLNVRENLHYKGLQAIENSDLAEALTFYLQILKQFPQDKIAMLMMSVCGFLSGKIDSLPETHHALYAYHSEDPDFLGMFAFLLAHQNQLAEARKYTEQALRIDPHNAWVQHVYAHTLDETNPTEIRLGIEFLEPKTEDWPKQSRFFEGHIWMHLCGLYFAENNKDIEEILSIYSQHIWGAAKEFNFEQNNALWILWQAGLHGYGDKIPTILRADLAKYAEPFMTDYVTPYLTVTAILSVAQFDLSKARIGLVAFKQYAHTLTPGSYRHHAWQEVALPVLQGCLDYLHGDYESACERLAPVAYDNRAMGHSDEQRILFSATFSAAQKKLFQKNTDIGSVPKF